MEFFISEKSFSLDVKIMVIHYFRGVYHIIKEICSMFCVDDVILLQWWELDQFGGIEALTRYKKIRDTQKLKKSAVAAQHWQNNRHQMTKYA